VNVETKEQSKQKMHTHSPNKPKKFKQTLSAYQKADGYCFLGQERSSGGGIHATMDHSNVRSELQNTKKNCVGPPIQKERHGMLTYGVRVLLLHDNLRPHTAARTRALLEHFNWALFDHIPHSLNLAPSDHHLFNYLKNWLGPWHFNSNEELMEDIKTWLSSQATDFFDTGTQKCIPRYKCLNSGGDYVEK
jgi:hypothetical protein